MMWDMELDGYLTNTTGPMSLVLDLRIVHERWGNSFDSSMNGHLHYPNDLDKPLRFFKMLKHTLCMFKHLEDVLTI